ncbi:MAG: site-specific integrase [Bdellovibrionales bacterium]|nr:site-specific integrase [Bdellovibrionales bacterium]
MADQAGELPLKRRGRPRRFAEYEALLAGLPRKMEKRPRYVNGVGLFRGERDITAWVKFTLPKGGMFRGKAYEPGEAAEIKLGKLSSWTWEQLEAERAKLIGRAERGEALDDAPVVRFNTFADEWHKNRKGAVKGWKLESSHLKNSLKPYFGKMDLNTITFQDVNEWQAKQLERETPVPGQPKRVKKVSAATVQRELHTLKTIMNAAKRAGLVRQSPCDGAQKLKGIEPRQRYLELEEAGKLVTVSAKIADWMPDFLTWLLHSGMRRGEALALTWDDVRKIDNRVFVAIHNVKTGKPRNIASTQEMVAILEREKKKHPDEKRVFPIAPIALKRKLKRLQQETGIKFRLHDLRRTNATHLARGGVDLRTLAGRIGHADLTMLHNVYSVFDRDDKAADVAQKIFGETLGGT